MAVAEAEICAKEQEEAAETTASNSVDCEVGRISGKEGRWNAGGEDAMAGANRPPVDGGGW